MAKVTDLSRLAARPAAPATQGSFGPPKAATIPVSGLNMQNRMPIGPGQILREFTPTPGERAIIEQYGWRDGDPAPENLADIIHSSHCDATQNLPLPVPANTPRLQMPSEQSIDSLSLDRQNDIFAAMAAAKRADDDAKRIQKMQFENAPPGVNEAIQAANVVDDRNQTTYSVVNTPKREKEQSLTGAAFERTHCQHCGWELANASPMDPTDADRFIFVQSVLGGIPFSKSVKAFNDQLLVTTRALSVTEVDLCHKQVYIEKGLGEVVTPFDVTESVMRYRLCLQLSQLKGAGMEYDLPDSVPGWVDSLKMAGLNVPEGHTPLRAIKQWMDENIFKTETIIRLVSVIVSDLNRLLVKLESNYLNSDFWKGTVA